MAKWWSKGRRAEAAADGTVACMEPPLAPPAAGRPVGMVAPVPVTPEMAQALAAAAELAERIGVPRCPRCGSERTRFLGAENGIQTRKCARPQCRRRFQVAVPLLARVRERCPECGSLDHVVVRGPRGDSRRRRHTCRACSFQFDTIEEGGKNA